jgi:hypothetical protein
MRLGILFRIHQTIAAIFLVILATEPAHALWLQVTGETLPVLAPLVIDLDSLKPPPGDTRHGLFAMPPSYRDTAAPRLKLQYRADFPRSVTFETDGAVTVERELPTGALNLTTRIILSEEWWWLPQFNANLGQVNLDEMTHGRIEAGQTGLRSEWKVKF